MRLHMMSAVDVWRVQMRRLTFDPTQTTPMDVKMRLGSVYSFDRLSGGTSPYLGWEETIRSSAPRDWDEIVKEEERTCE